MAKKKANKKTVGAFGEDTRTNQPAVPLPLAPEPIESEPPVETPSVPKTKEQPGTWPFSKSNVTNEKKEMEHVSRLVNMKHDNPGVVKVTKVVIYDCLSRQIKCRDYKIEYK
ncbi:MAG: hypothetical protein MUO27_00895 [Sedimentisphaerales bacterium]|nr:hypothetical protein [Sedimentisphaerales bacterium]